METVARTQTAFRLKDSLLERLKWRAKREKKSVNAFVEEVLEEKVGRVYCFIQTVGYKVSHTSRFFVLLDLPFVFKLSIFRP